MEDIYIKYLREYYEVHGTINDISTLSSVEYENQVLNIGNFLGNVRKRYKEHLAGKREFSNQVLNRFSALNEMEFEWNPRAAKSKNIKETDAEADAIDNSVQSKVDNFDDNWNDHKNYLSDKNNNVRKWDTTKQ